MRKRHYSIDHRVLFAIGYLFYFFIPYFVGERNAFAGYPGMEIFQSLFKQIPKQKLETYLTITISWLPAFFLGHYFFSIFKPFRRDLKKFSPTVNSEGAHYIVWLLFSLLFVFVILGRNSLFAGYGSYDIGVRGKFSTLLTILNFFLIYQLITLGRPGKILLFTVCMTAILLLSMGGRLYVMQTLIILLIYKTSYSARRWRISRICLFLLACFGIGSLFGLWRMGASWSLTSAAYSLFAEPSFTWFSTSSLLIFNDIPLFNFPSNFLTSFLNLVPNTIVSLKPFIVTTASMVNNYQSPLGADSVWSTIIINFGSMGSFFFMFITGYLLNFLRHLSERHRFWAAYYILVCAMLPFQFFRDGFYIIHKQLYFNFLLFPALLLLVGRLLIFLQVSSLTLRKLNKSETADT